MSRVCVHASFFHPTVCDPSSSDARREGTASKAGVLPRVSHSPGHHPTLQDTQNWNTNSSESGLQPLPR